MEKLWVRYYLHNTDTFTNGLVRVKCWEFHCNVYNTYVWKWEKNTQKLRTYDLTVIQSWCLWTTNKTYPKSTRHEHMYIHLATCSYINSLGGVVAWTSIFSDSEILSDMIGWVMACFSLGSFSRTGEARIYIQYKY